jgi:hypothetical protein
MSKECFVQRLSLSVILVVLLWSAGCSREGAVLVEKSSDAESPDYRIQQITFLRDPSGTLGPNDVLGPPWTEEFREFGRGIPSFGFSTDAVWCRIDLPGRSSGSVVAELASTRLDHVTWYEVCDGRILQEVRNGWQDGNRGEPAPASYPALRIDVSPEQTYTLLIRVCSECALTLPVTLVREQDFDVLTLRRGYVAHLQVGASIAVVATCLLLGLTFRDVLFVLLGLFGIAGFVYGALYDPVLSLQPFPIPPSFSRIGGSLAASVASFVLIMFCGAYAGWKNLSPVDRLLLIIAVLLTVSLLLLHLTLPFRSLNRILGLCLTFTECCGIWIISSPWRHKRESTDFFVLLVVLLAHVPALMFILQLEQMVPTLLPPQSLRFVPLPTVVSGITCVLIRRRQSAEQLRFSIAQAQAGESEARLAALRMQLNPHMLLNCLTAVSALSRTAPERIPVLIDNLAAILQSRLKPTPPQLWTLAEELHLARALVELDHVRYTDSPALHESVQLEAESCLVPEMLLQPLVENALKYGRTGTGPPVICLSATVAGNRLAITISNKRAIGKSAHFFPGFGIGMQNIRQRLELLYGHAAKFELELTPGHFKAILGLPAVQQP